MCLLFLFSCTSDVAQPSIEDAPYELAIPEGFPMPTIPANNPLTKAGVALGKKLFFDPILSLDSTIACVSCHLVEHAFSDTLPFSKGVEGKQSFRNSPSLLNVAYHDFFFREGGIPTLELQSIVPIEEESEMNLSLLHLIERLDNSPIYPSLFYKAYGEPPSVLRLTHALASFQRTLISGNTPFDRYTYQQEVNALSEQAKRGMALFFNEKTNCSVCHNGFNFTNNGFANNGLYEVYQDLGKGRLTQRDKDIGVFKIPSLRSIALTAPYMHDGSLVSLKDVIEHYDNGGQIHRNKNVLIKPLELSEQEKKDILVFLESLTDTSLINNPLFLPE